MRSERSLLPLIAAACSLCLALLAGCDVPVVETPDGYGVVDDQTADETGDETVDETGDEADATGSLSDVDASAGDVAAAPPEWHVISEDLEGVALSMWGSSPDDLWVVGADTGSGPLLLQFDGEAWIQHDTGATGDLWWVFGTPDEPVTFVGEGGTILQYHRDSGNFTTLDSGTDALLFGVWGTAWNELYIAGGYNGVAPPVLLRVVDDVVTPIELEDGDVAEDANLFKVWGSGEDDVWAVGTEGAMLHFDGEAWSKELIQDDPDFVTVHGAHAQDVVVVGDIGNLGSIHQRGDDDAWIKADLGTDTSIFNGVYVAPDGYAVAVGNSSSVWQRVAGEWSDMELVSAHSWHAAHIDALDNVYVLGGDLTGQDLGAIYCYGTSCAGVDYGDDDAQAEPDADAGSADVMDGGEVIEDVADTDVGPEEDALDAEAPETDAGDAAVEVDTDVGPDEPDADTIEDVVADVTPDVEPDVLPDVPPDVPTDPEDVGPADAGPDDVSLPQLDHDVVADNEFLLQMGIGESAETFVPLETYQDLEIIQGPQGGVHMEFNFLLETDYSQAQFFAAVLGTSSIDGVPTGYTLAPKLLVSGTTGEFVSLLFFVQFFENQAAFYIGDGSEPTWVELCIEVTIDHDELADGPDTATMCEIVSAIDTVDESLE